MGYDVFISYSTQDKLTADAVCGILESQGLRCWIAPRDIPLGADWTESLVEAIELCPVMVLVFSKHANDSHQIKREVNLAIDNGRTVIPVRVEEVMPSKSLKFSININHWLDAFPPPLDHHLRLLGDSIRGHLRKAELDKESAAAAAAAASAPISAAPLAEGSACFRHNAGAGPAFRDRADDGAHLTQKMMPPGLPVTEKVEPEPARAVPPVLKKAEPAPARVAPVEVAPAPVAPLRSRRSFRPRNRRRWRRNNPKPRPSDRPRVWLRLLLSPRRRSPLSARWSSPAHAKSRIVVLMVSALWAVAFAVCVLLASFIILILVIAIHGKPQNDDVAPPFVVLALMIAAMGYAVWLGSRGKLPGTR